MANIYHVDFCVVKKQSAAPAAAGAAYSYRRSLRSALVSAGSDQGIQAVLNADIPVLAGEVIEILHSHTISIGTEGLAVLT